MIDYLRIESGRYFDVDEKFFTKLVYDCVKNIDTTLYVSCDFMYTKKVVYKFC